MTMVQERFNKALDIYNNLSSLLESLYDRWNSKVNFKFSKDELMNDFDYYIQCYLIKIALANKNIASIEFEYIIKLVKYHNYISLDDHKNPKNNDFSKRNNLNNFANNGLSKIPIFAKLFSILEIVSPKDPVLHKTTWPLDLLDKLQELGLTLAVIDGTVDIIEEKTVKEYLYIIIDYFTTKNQLTNI